MLQSHRKDTFCSFPQLETGAFLRLELDPILGAGPVTSICIGIQTKTGRKRISGSDGLEGSFEWKGDAHGAHVQFLNGSLCSRTPAAHARPLVYKTRRFGVAGGRSLGRDDRHMQMLSRRGSRDALVFTVTGEGSGTGCCTDRRS